MAKRGKVEWLFHMCPNRRKPVVRQRKSSTHTLTLHRNSTKPPLKGYSRPCLTNSIMRTSKTDLSKNFAPYLAVSTRTRQQLKSLSSETREWLCRTTGNSTVTIGVATATDQVSCFGYFTLFKVHIYRNKDK